MIKYQKVIKVGNSLAVTLDQVFLQQTGIQVGDTLAAAYKPENKLFSMSQAKNGVLGKVASENETSALISGKITPELEDWTENFLRENNEALKALKDL
jgi:antitoxin component of MazEF toxin-antitoxin module